MKKLIIITFALLSVTFTAQASTPCADNQSPNGYISSCSPDYEGNVTSPITLSVTFNTAQDAWDYAGCSMAFDDTAHMRIGDGAPVPITDLTVTKTISADIGNSQTYEPELEIVEYGCSSTLLFLFNVISATNIIFPAVLSAEIAQNVGNQLGDTGTLALLGVIIGVPLAFYVFHKLIGLIPKDRDRVSERTGRAMRKTDKLLRS